MYTFGEFFGMLSFEVDGMDVTGFHRGLERALAHARAGKGPVLMETNTYRYKGHSMSDPQKYRTKEELENYKNLDPISKLADFLIDSGIQAEESLAQMEVEIRDEIEDAVKFAEDSPLPDHSELYKDVYMQQDYPYITD
jgi:pyruvate dehydrogenase E1 component alpha subunit